MKAAIDRDQPMHLSEAMSTRLSIGWFVGFILLAVTASVAPAAEKSKSVAKTPEQSEADYSRAIEQRTADIMAVLKVDDSGKSNRVHDVIIAQYRALRLWHDSNDSRLKTLSKQEPPASKKDQEQIQASLKAQHTNFIGSLSRELSPDQVEAVKDKMTYGTVKVTHDAYCQMIPTLTEPEKVHLMELLKEAREEAMDGGSSQEKAAIFKKYKGKINNYLSAQGHDVEKDRKDWVAREKSKTK
jgi:seryl-tRNA(Sec) selenium transferase